ncbi:hypothetical protein QQF64_017082 [Cirrhinus molitorella]|uniref:Uncharacterized protein n=1 Tax=Cirrhinus molitorella TaxID=172907 RepID=A0ABR3LL23_9TELE
MQGPVVTTSDCICRDCYPTDLFLSHSVCLSLVPHILWEIRSEMDAFVDTHSLTHSLTHFLSQELWVLTQGLLARWLSHLCYQDPLGEVSSSLPEHRKDKETD